MIRKYCSLLAFCLCLVLGAAAQTSDLKITVANIRDDRGYILMALHTPAENYIEKRFLSLKI